LIIIFIGSYLNVPCVIDTINREGSEFRILSTNREVLKFFSELYSPDVVIELPQLFTHFRNIRLFFADTINLMRHKKHFSNMLMKLRPKKLFFFFVTEGFFECWLINKLSPSTEIYYRPKINISVVKKTKNVRLLVKSTFFRVIYGCAFSPFKLYQHEFVGFDKMFLKKIRAKTYPDINKNNNIWKIFSDRFPKFDQGSVLLLLNSGPNIDEDEFKKKINFVFEKLFEKYSYDKVLVKHHPNFSDSEVVLPVGCICIPDYYPASLFSYKTPIVISYASAALFEAANLGQRAISLAFLISSTKQGQADAYKKYLLSNTNGTIDFPKTFDEFSQLLNKKYN
jgi:hypothetical protein